MTEKEKLHTGGLYLPGDEDIMKEQFQCMERLYDFNATRPHEYEKRMELLKEMFASVAPQRRASFTAGTSALTSSAASAGVLFIFQLPAIMALRIENVPLSQSVMT